MQTATRKTHSRIPIPVICRRSIAVTATIAALMVLTAATAGAATPLFNENFSYAAASNLNGQGGWTAHSAAARNPQLYCPHGTGDQQNHDSERNRNLDHRQALRPARQ